MNFKIKNIGAIYQLVLFLIAIIMTEVRSEGLSFPKDLDCSHKPLKGSNFADEREEIIQKQIVSFFKEHGDNSLWESELKQERVLDEGLGLLEIFKKDPAFPRLRVMYTSPTSMRVDLIGNYDAKLVILFNQALLTSFSRSDLSEISFFWNSHWKEVKGVRGSGSRNPSGLVFQTELKIRNL